MTKLVTCAEALSLDESTALEWKLSSGVLMENAACRLWAALDEILRQEKSPRSGLRILALAGGGNNGGDALALLRQVAFSSHHPVEAIILPGRRGELAVRHAESLVGGGISVHVWGETEAREAMARADIIIDGIAGTGLRGGLRGEALELALAANAAGKRIAALDLPSGFRDGMEIGETCVKATWTLSIEPRKACLYAPLHRSMAGAIIPIKGVFPSRLALPVQTELLDPDGFEGSGFANPITANDVHKGDRGRLAVFAGSPGMLGAAAFAVRAAYAGGAGLVCLFCSRDLFGSLGGGAALEAFGGAIIRPEDSFFEEPSRFDAVLAGPGWGASDQNQGFLRRLLETDLPLVLDASALRILPAIALSPRDRTLVLTPHPGEFEALTGISPDHSLLDPKPPLTALSKRLDATVMLKAATSWIAGRDGQLRVLDGREAGLAVAGSGDVLAGLCAGILAGLHRQSTIDPREWGMYALCQAAIAHLLAGRDARASEGWFEAGALIPRVARILGQA